MLIMGLTDKTKPVVRRGRKALRNNRVPGRRRLGFLLIKGEEMRKWNLLALVIIFSSFFCLVGSGAAYPGGTMIDLGTLPGGTTSEASGINTKGQIVGWSYTTSGYQHAFLYSGGKMIDLGTLPGGLYSFATGINDNGQIVGYSDTESGEEHAFLYYPGASDGPGRPGWRSQQGHWYQ